MPRTAQRQDRISVRLSPQSKRTLERAAAYADKTVTDFVLDSALKSADALVRKHEVITLEAADWDVFYAALLNPPKPNAKLRKALAWYARVKRE